MYIQNLELVYICDEFIYVTLLALVFRDMHINKVFFFLQMLNVK